MLAVMAGLLYFFAGMRYRNTFFPNTEIGGIDASGKTVDQVKAEIRGRCSRYVLTLAERGGGEEQICGDEIDLHPVFDGTLERILEGQKFWCWGFWAARGRSYPAGDTVELDREKLQAAVRALSCMEPERITEPRDAYLAYEAGIGLQIVGEEPGNEPVEELLLAEAERAALSLKERISLEELNVYRQPAVRADDPGLMAELEAKKPYADVKIVYRFGSQTETLDGTAICQWLIEGEDGAVSVDRAKAEEYVRYLAATYNTAYCAKEFKTSYGPTVTLTKGHYGWLIDKEAETEALMEIIASGESQEREPVYAQRAASHDGPDYGDTYVEMNLTAQHLFFYKNGKLLVESDFVSGNEARGWSTPAGAYELTYKQRNAVLKGKNYKTPVSYWMAFNGNIGMHDGYWRTSFGGTIYKKNGSHGCINLPPAVAKTIYENIEAHVPVLCYHLEGTETGKTTVISGGKKEAGKETGKGQGAGASAGGGSQVVEESGASTGGGSQAVEGSGTVAEGGSQAAEGTVPPAGTASPAPAENGKAASGGSQTVEGSGTAAEDGSQTASGSGTSAEDGSQTAAGSGTATGTANPAPDNSVPPAESAIPAPDSSGAASGPASQSPAATMPPAEEAASNPEIVPPAPE